MVDAEGIRHLLQKAVLDPVPRQCVSVVSRCGPRCWKFRVSARFCGTVGQASHLGFQGLGFGRVTVLRGTCPGELQSSLRQTVQEILTGSNLHCHELHPGASGYC